MPNEQGEAICLLSDDVTDWSVIKYCEPSCSERGGCDNNQVCAKPIGESIEKCVCAGYTGKYCENVDSQGFFFLSLFLLPSFFLILLKNSFFFRKKRM